MKINKNLKKKTRNETPCHSTLCGGIICGSGSFVVQFGDHFRSGDHLRRCTDDLVFYASAILVLNFMKPHFVLRMHYAPTRVQPQQGWLWSTSFVTVVNEIVPSFSPSQYTHDLNKLPTSKYYYYYFFITRLITDRIGPRPVVTLRYTLQL